MGSELKHLGCEDILAAKGNAWALEKLVYIEIAEELPSLGNGNKPKKQSQILIQWIKM